MTLVVMTLLVGANCEKQEERHSTVKPGNIPSSLKEEHEELHAGLAKITALPGNTGKAAQKVADALHPHFVSEEEYAMPPLALLQDLAAGKYGESMNEEMLLSKKLKEQLPQMLKEHQEIVSLLSELESAAAQEDHPEAVEFAKRLKAHAVMEEQVLYPASILVGEYLDMKSKTKQ